MISKVRVCFLAFLASLSASAVLAQDEKLGKELYDGRCLSCHKDTPYGKGPPKAQSLEAVRATAKLWASIAPGTPWTQPDMDDVVLYLNQNFYHY
jgi:mono/diheme cytochrome c family protein